MNVNRIRYVVSALLKDDILQGQKHSQVKYQGDQEGSFCTRLPPPHLPYTVSGLMLRLFPAYT